MDEPSSISIAIRFSLLLLGGIVIPQTVGIFSLRRAWRKQKKILLIPALWVAPVIFFVAAASFGGVWGVALHLALSGGVLFSVWFTDKRRYPSAGESSPIN